MSERAGGIGKVVGVSVVCAALTAAVVVWAGAGAARAPEARPVEASGGGEALEAMGGQVERLSARVEALEAEVARLEELRRLDARGGGASKQARASAVAATGGRGGEPKASGKIEAEVARMLDEGASPVRERVGEIIRDEMDIAREERRMRRREQMTERVHERVAEFAKANGLSAEQHKAMAKLLVDERTKSMELRRTAREEGGGGRDGMRERARALREETARALGEILSAEQLEAYQAQREQSRRERGGGGRGRGRGL